MTRDEAKAQAREIERAWAWGNGDSAQELNDLIVAALLAAVEAERARCEAVLREMLERIDRQKDEGYSWSGALKEAADAIAARKPQP